MCAATITNDSLSASDDGTGAEGGFAGGRVWGSTAGVWSSRDGAERRHLLGTVVAHSELSDDLMLGGMLQLGLSENSTTLRMAS